MHTQPTTIGSRVVVWSALALSLGACVRQPKDRPLPDTDLPVVDSLKPTDTAPWDDCFVAVKRVYPGPDASDVYHRTTFTASFTGDQRDRASFTLVDRRDGADVPLGTPTWSEDGKDVLLAPVSPLEPQAAYTWTVSYSCGDVQIPFAVSDVGAAVNTTSLSGRTYVFDLGQARLLQPFGVGQLLTSLFVGDERNRLVVLRAKEGFTHVVDKVGFEAGFVAQDGTDLVQDPCLQTYDETVATGWVTHNPYLGWPHLGDLALPSPGGPITLHDAVLEGSFTPDAGAIVGGELRFTLDAREFAPLILEEEEDPDPNAGCDLLRTFTSGGVRCGPCPPDMPLGPGDHCVTFWFDQITAPDRTADFVAEGGWVPRPAADIAADAACADGPSSILDGCDCATGAQPRGVMVLGVLGLILVRRRRRGA